MPAMNDYDSVDERFNINNYDYDDVDYGSGGDSDEDTEDASETESMKYQDEHEQYDHEIKKEPNYELKEQIYQSKLLELKKELEALKSKTHPDYVAGKLKIETEYKDRIFFAEVVTDLDMQTALKEYLAEEKVITREYQERVYELKETAITDYEESRKTLEVDPDLDLTNESVEPKPLPTRKLRRRPNEPTPVPERRRRTSPTQINYRLEESDITEDLKLIDKFTNSNSANRMSIDGDDKANNSQNQSTSPIASTSSSSTTTTTTTATTTTTSTTTIKNGSSTLKSISSTINSNPVVRIDCNKLFYDKKWFHRGQEIYLETPDGSILETMIYHIGSNEIITRRSNDFNKVKVTVNDLQNRRYFIARI